MISATFREEYNGASILVTANDLPPWSSDSERIVIVDGSGPLADRELRLCSFFLHGRKKGGTTSASIVPLGRMLFCMQKISRLWPVAFEIIKRREWICQK